jgi:hypothetical protein
MDEMRADLEAVMATVSAFISLDRLDAERINQERDLEGPAT